MAPPKSVEVKRKHFSVEEANKMLPLIRAIVGDIVRQLRVVNDLSQRLSAVMQRRRQSTSDLYSEELAQTEAETQAEKSKLQSYYDELEQLGVELKGPDGLCDFPSLMEGREVYLCWRLGEPEIMFWHEIHDGFPGRKPLSAPAAQPQRTGHRTH